MDAALEVKVKMSKRKKQGLENGIDNYVTDHKLSKARRAAHFFAWAKENYPYEFANWDVTLQAIEGYGKRPSLKSKEVLALRRQGSFIRATLENDYGMCLVSQPGVGARATVDDGDMAKHAMTRRMKVLSSAQKAAEKTFALIDPQQIPNTPEFRPYKDWINKDVREVLKLTGTETFQRKCLPPASVPDSGNSENK